MTTRRAHIAHPKQKMGHRPCERCSNCQFCVVRVKPQERRGKPIKSGYRTIDVQVSTSARDGFKRKISDMRKYESQDYFCALGQFPTSLSSVCNFHVHTDMPLKDKPTYAPHQHGKPNRVRFLKDLLWKTIRAVEGGVPERPKIPDTVSQAAVPDVPEELAAHVYDHWELLMDEWTRYHKQLFEFRKCFASHLAFLLNRSERAYYSHIWSERPEMDIYEMAVKAAYDQGKPKPIWKWHEVMRAIKGGKVSSAWLRELEATRQEAVQPAQEDAAEADRSDRVPLRQTEAECQKEGQGLSSDASAVQDLGGSERVPDSGGEKGPTEKHRPDQS